MKDFQDEELFRQNQQDYSNERDEDFVCVSVVLGDVAGNSLSDSAISKEKILLKIFLSN